MIEYPDINTKINYLFEIPITPHLIQRFGQELDSERRMEQALNREVLPKMVEYIKPEFPAFTAKFVVTRTNPLIKGQFQSQSIVKTSMDRKGLPVLIDLLNEFSGGTKVFAQININCFL